MSDLAFTETTARTRASAIDDKWGEVARAGYQIVPDLLLKHQGELAISPTELVVLLNILMHWWYRDQKPFPRSTTIARRMGVTLRTVQRALLNLEQGGLIKREKGPQDSTFVDPSPLVKRLTDIGRTDVDYLIRKGGLVA